ncbi:MAG: acyl-CoA thioesterase domain-containing protein [Actinomycetota bacterium]
MSNAYFHQVDDGPGHRLEPQPIAHGPWATDMLHGRLLGGLGARAIEADFGGDGWRAARLTVDLFRPSAMAAVTATTRSVRAGRRLRVVDALLTCEGHEVGRVSAVLLPTGEEPPGRVWAPEPSTWPDPETLTAPDGGSADDDLYEDGDGPNGELNGWLFRLVEGGFGTGRRTRVWTNDTVPLVAGEHMSPLVRAAISGDIACPLGNSSDEGLYFINADYTMLIGRYPVGDWVGVAVDHRITADGISITSSTLVDRDGPFATSGGTSLARPPLEGHGQDASS